jgi:hypothetical protein
MYTEQEYWRGPCKQRTHPAAVEGYDDDDDGPDPPYPMQDNTLVIWYRKDCLACQVNAPLFERLERHNNGFRVLRVQASDRRLRSPRYRGAVRVVPQYDVIHYRPQNGYGVPGSEAYGPDTIVTSVPNTEQGRLAAHFPDVPGLSAL